jgi:hypothetical protein
MGDREYAAARDHWEVDAKTSYAMRADTKKDRPPAQGLGLAVTHPFV